MDGLEKKHKYDNLEYVESLINEYKTVGDLMKRNNALYLKIRDNNWRNILYPKLNYRKRFPTSFWSKNNLAEYAKKFKTKKDFYMSYTCAYRIAQKNKWLNDICKHMIK